MKVVVYVKGVPENFDGDEYHYEISRLGDLEIHRGDLLWAFFPESQWENVRYHDEA